MTSRKASLFQCSIFVSIFCIDFINCSVAPREGANIHGLYIEGARWDIGLNSIVPSKLKELFSTLPIVYVKAVTRDKQDKRNIYECPVYRTRCDAAFSLTFVESSSPYFCFCFFFLLLQAKRSHLHVDIQFENQRESIEMDFSWCCHYITNINSFKLW